MKKKALIILSSCIAVLIALIVTVFVAVPAGSCGDGAFFVISGNKLTVFGKGVVNSVDADKEKLENVYSLIVKSGITAIKEGAFTSLASLEKVYICETVEEIMPLAFSGCTSLKEFAVSEENSYYSADEHGVLFDKKQNLLLNYPAAKEDAFYEIPKSVSVISVSAFANAVNLQKINFPSGLKDIENHAFSGCTGLREAILPSGLTGIGTQSFFECDSLERIVIPGSVKAISTAALSMCDVLDEIYFIGTSEQWEHLLVEGNNNWSVTPTVSLIIGFGECGERASFIITRDRELVIKGTGSVDDSSGWSDDANKILSVTVCYGVTELSENIFDGLSRAQTVSVPKSVKNIGASAFGGFTSEQTIKIDNTASFAEENFSDLWNENCKANIIFN